jgi:dihydrolipoamide dehydrogenase
MIRRVEVAIIGAGSAGLAAVHEVCKITNDYIVVDEGTLGTTCARVGCMPSKALIHIANEFHRRSRWKGTGIRGGASLVLNLPEALARVRALRDRFAGEVVRSTNELGSRLVRGRARLLGASVIRVGPQEFFARRLILATGSRPIVPQEFLAFGSRLVTTDSLFDLKDLPRRVGLIGIGVIGLELGQALSRLGCDVVAFDQSGSIAGLGDPEINSCAFKLLSKEFPLHLKSETTAHLRSGKILLGANRRTWERDMILATLGRRPNLEGLGLETTGAVLDERGCPSFDRRTMQLDGFPIFIAGDAGDRSLILHEASDDGRIAGYNSVRPTARRFQRRAPIAVAFSDPNVALVGKKFSELERGRFVVGEAKFLILGRALIAGENHGLLHVYADRRDGELLGAEMIAPSGEHLAHLLAWSFQQKMTVFDMLAMPFYHPTMEEGLRTALVDAAEKIPESSASSRRRIVGFKFAEK